MKKITILSLVIAGMVSLTNIAIAQGNGKGKVDRAQKEMPAQAKDKMEKGIDKGEKEVKEIKGELDGKGHDNIKGKGHSKNHDAESIKEEVEHIKEHGKDKADEMKEHGKEDHSDNEEDHEEYAGDHENKGKGHGYGKDKGDLSGKDFGQHRAEEAKLNKENKVKELDSNISNGEDKVAAAREKINASKQKLEENKKTGKISDAEYAEELQKIIRAEEGVKKLEYSLQKGKELNNTYK